MCFFQQPASEGASQTHEIGVVAQNFAPYAGVQVAPRRRIVARACVILASFGAPVARAQKKVTPTIFLRRNSAAYASSDRL